jgi:hypothetical protein
MLAAAPAAKSELTFEFDYSDPSAALWPAEARAALEVAGKKVASYFTAHTATISITITGFNDPDNYFYALSGTNWNLTGGTPGFNNPGVVGAKILSNGAIDQNGADPDGYIIANMGDWYGYGDTVDSTVADFTLVMMHELGHPLGFFGNLSETGTVAFDGYYTPYVEFLSNSLGERIVKFNSGTGLWEVDTALWELTSTGAPANGLYFSGPNAMKANGGKPVALYSPDTWWEGSSEHHLDDTLFGGMIMNPGIPLGPHSREFSEIEIGIFRDLGYTVVPEVNSAVLTLLGLAAAARCRRRKSVLSQ